MSQSEDLAQVGNQLPILLIDFAYLVTDNSDGWESVTNPLDRLPAGGYAPQS